MVSLDFSPAAQAKARKLAERVGAAPEIVEADVHVWEYPEAAFDAVVEIFTQFSAPAERELKWAGMRRTLRPGGVLILQGYTPRQLAFGTGGPKTEANLYTEAMLRAAFGGLTRRSPRGGRGAMFRGPGPPASPPWSAWSRTSRRRPAARGTPLTCSTSQPPGPASP